MLIQYNATAHTAHCEARAAHLFVSFVRLLRSRLFQCLRRERMPASHYLVPNIIHRAAVQSSSVYCMGPNAVGWIGGKSAAFEYSGTRARSSGFCRAICSQVALSDFRPQPRTRFHSCDGNFINGIGKGTWSNNGKPLKTLRFAYERAAYVVTMPGERCHLSAFSVLEQCVACMDHSCFSLTAPKSHGLLEM